jgi:hypothetical protein
VALENHDRYTSYRFLDHPPTMDVTMRPRVGMALRSKILKKDRLTSQAAMAYHNRARLLKVSQASRKIDHGKKNFSS